MLITMFTYFLSLYLKLFVSTQYMIYLLVKELGTVMEKLRKACVLDYIKQY